MDFQVWTVMMNSALLTKVTSEHKKCESQSTKVTYVQAYNNISLIFFCVVPDSVSLAANYCIYNYHRWALSVCVCVCMTFNFILYSAFDQVMPGMFLSKTVASCTNFRDDVSAFMVWSRSTGGWLYGIVLSCVKPGFISGWGLVHLLPPFSHPLGIKAVLKLIVLNIYKKKQ